MHRFNSLFLPIHWTNPDIPLSQNWWILQKLLLSKTFDLHCLWSRFNAWQVGKATFSSMARIFLWISRCRCFFLRLSWIFLCFSWRTLMISCTLLRFSAPWFLWIFCSAVFRRISSLLYLFFFENLVENKQFVCFPVAAAIFLLKPSKIARRYTVVEKRLG